VVTANDIALPAPGNLATPANETIAVDTIFPVVSVTAPAVGILTKGTTPLTFTATDANPAVTIVKVDGTIITPTPAALGPLTDGSHVVIVESTDAAGNLTTVTRTFIADATPPAINLVSPPVKLAAPSPTDGTIGVTSPVLTFPVTDANADPTKTTVTFDGAPLVAVSGTTTLGPFVEGAPHSLVISATDLAGNVTTTTRNFTLHFADGAITTLGATEPVIGDVLAALRHVAQLNVIAAGDTFKHGDVAPLVNGVPVPDGVIDIGDVLLILRKVAKLATF
jgi:hypothetical protein